MSRSNTVARRLVALFGTAVALCVLQLRRQRQRHHLTNKGRIGTGDEVTPWHGLQSLPERKTSLWATALASTAGYTAYLALLGGLLLAIRFWHAGLPVTQAVSAVPLATLVTTALVEVFFPLLGVAFVMLFTASAWVPLMKGPPYDDSRSTKVRPPEKIDIWTGRISKAFGVLIIVGITPLSAWGATFALGMVVLLFASDWMRHLHKLPTMTPSHRVGICVAVLLIFPSIPVLVRQAVEPLNMERVTISRPGQSPLKADLVAVRDTSIVVARCRELYVLPTPTSMRIEHLPGSWGSGSSIFEKLGIGSNKSIRPRPMPCHEPLLRSSPRHLESRRVRRVHG